MVSQHRLESFLHEIKCNGVTSFKEFMGEVMMSSSASKVVITRLSSDVIGSCSLVRCNERLETHTGGRHGFKLWPRTERTE